MEFLKAIFEVLQNPDLYVGILAGLGALKLLAKATKTDWDDKVIDMCIKIVTYPLNLFKKPS